MEVQPKGNFTVLIFETNIRFKKDVSKISRVIKEESRIHKWNVDREDSSKILRVVSSNIRPSEIIDLVKQAGFSCAELND